MKKIKQLLFFAFLFVCSEDLHAGTMTNTATTITLTGTCLSVPAGTYTMTIHYTDLVSGPTGDHNYSVTVAVSGTVVTITATGATFPTVAGTGYYDLSDVNLGLIYLTNATNTGTVRWDVHNIYCDANFPTLVLTIAGQEAGNHIILVNYTVTNPSLIAGYKVFRSTDGGSTFYYVASVANSGSGFYTDGIIPPFTGATDKYYFVVSTTDGSCFTTNTISTTCSGCSYTKPGQYNCSDVLTGTNHICALQDHENYTLTNYNANQNTITWAVYPAGSAYVFQQPCNQYAGVTLIKNAYTGVVQLSATQTGCPQIYATQILMGLPTNLHIVTNLTQQNGNYMAGEAYCDNIPGTTDASYTWTLTLNTTVTHYTGKIINIQIPPCNGGYLAVTVVTPCGTTSDQSFVYNGLGCGGMFMMAPNPATGSVQIAVAKTASSGVSAEASQQNAVTAGQQNAVTAGQQNATMAAPSITAVKIYNKMGTLVLNKTFPAGPALVNIDIASLPADTYVVHILYGKNNVETQELLVTH